MIKGVRKEISKVNAYVSGKTIEEVQEFYGLKDVVKLGSNENPYAPFKNTLLRMKNELENLYKYPGYDFKKLKKVLAEKYDAKDKNFAISHGAGGMIETISKAFIEKGDEVIMPLQSYGLYREVSNLMGAKVIDIPLDENYTIDIKAIQNHVNENTKLIWICNPNNPTGTLFGNDEFETLLNNIPEHTWVILDEAYAEFVDAEKLPKSIDYIKENKNIIVIRTFSKSYGLAGCRIGYAIANEEIINVIDTVAEPFNANRIALVAAIASITEDTQQYLETISKIKSDRQWITEKLNDLGFSTSQSQANFVFFNTSYDATEIGQKLIERGVIVRPCVGWKYPNSIRVSIGKRHELETFYSELCKVIE